MVTFLQIEMGIQEVLNEYKENKHKIKEPYAKLLSEYFDNLKKENNKGRSKGDRKYSARNFKKPFISFLKKEGFEVYTEVNLFKPSKTISILPKNIIKEKYERFKDIKRNKNIDFIAIRNTEKKKIIFIELKMKITTSFILPGLFELGLIDTDKLPKDYSFYLILFSTWTRNADKYQICFDLLKDHFIEPKDESICELVIIDPKKFINGDEFYSKVLS